MLGTMKKPYKLKLFAMLGGCTILLFQLFHTSAWAAKGEVTLQSQKGKSVKVKVELALTEAQREKGLMFRKKMAENAGMLFVFGTDDVKTFWMKNTFIPLDMIFIDKSLKIVGIVENAQPQTLSPRSVYLPSRYVLEVNGGFSKKIGLAAGDQVYFSGVPLR